MNLAHKECNRMKGSKSLQHVQKKMGFKRTAKKKTTKKTTKKKRTQISNMDSLIWGGKKPSWA